MNKWNERKKDIKSYTEAEIYEKILKKYGENK